MDKEKAVRHLLEQGTLPTVENIQALTSTLKTAAFQTQVAKTMESYTSSNTRVDILKNYVYEPRKIVIKDFLESWRNRYTAMKNILLNRAEAQDAISINRAKQSHESKITIIAMVSDIIKLPTGTFKLEVEDLTGTMTVIVPKRDPELMEKAKFITYDEVLAFKGSFSRNVLFVDDIIWPGIPLREIPRCPEDVYVAFSGDLHTGSDVFLPKKLDRFIKWLRGEIGSSAQKDIAKKTKYIFFVGDMVDGVGIYPQQEKELLIKDIYKQFEAVAKHLEKIPSDKKIIICTGNHDGVRIAEPQPPLYKDIAAPLYALPNTIIVSNPALVKVHAFGDFPGTTVLMYHGYGFDYFVDKIEGLRLLGGYDRPDKIMDFLLRRRHLAPTYGSTLVLPMKEDPHLIYQVPDVIVTGHIHRATIASYKNTLMISASCWQGNTSFMEKLGHHPAPAKVPLLNLKTGDTRMLDFN